MTPERGRTLTIVETSLILCTTCAVLAFGGTESVSLAITEIALLITAVVALFGFTPNKGWREIAGSARVPGALLALVSLQLLPLPPQIPAWLRPSHRPWDLDSPGHPTNAFTTLSIAPHNTRAQLLILVCCICVYFLAQIAVRRQAARKRLVAFLLILGSFEALYGLVEYLSGYQRIFGYIKKYNLEEATGTYVNRNHFAGFLEMVIPFGLALLLYQNSKSAARAQQSAKKLKTILSGNNLPRTGLRLFAVVIMSAGLFFSRSRMGMVAALAALILMVVLYATQGRTGIWPATVSLACVALLVLWLGAGNALGRFGNISDEYLSSGESRFSLWQGTARLIAGHPLLGSGLGTFPVAFTAVQNTFLGKFVNHAHNDYLEIASDLGLPAALLLFGAIVGLLFRVGRRVVSVEPRFDKAVALGCLGSIVAILLHSLTDFNLYIPANAIVFSLILGLATAISANLERGSLQHEA